MEAQTPSGDGTSSRHAQVSEGEAVRTAEVALRERKEDSVGERKERSGSESREQGSNYAPPADHSTSTDGDERATGGRGVQASGLGRIIAAEAGLQAGREEQRTSLTSSSSAVDVRPPQGSEDPSVSTRERVGNDMAAARERARLAVVVALEEQMDALANSSVAAMNAMEEEVSSLRAMVAITKEKLKAVELERDSLRNTVSALHNENSKLREQVLTHVQLQQNRIKREQEEQQKEACNAHQKSAAAGDQREACEGTEASSGLKTSESDLLVGSNDSIASDSAGLLAGSPTKASKRDSVDELSSPSAGGAGGGSANHQPGQAKLKRITVLRKLSETSFNGQNTKHGELVAKLVRNTFGENIPHDPLLALGFTSNLEKDLEKTGVLGLLNMVYISERYQSFLRKIIHRGVYPFAQAGLAITSLLATLLDLEGNKVSTEISTVFLNLMDTHPKTFEEMYCAGVRLYDNATKEPGVTPHQALHNTGQTLRSMLSKKPKTLADLMSMTK